MPGDGIGVGVLGSRAVAVGVTDERLGVDERWSWGLDPSTRIPVVVAVQKTRFVVRRVPLPAVRGPVRLPRLREEIRRATVGLLARCPPRRVAVEQPSGKYRNLPLVYAVGVTIEAVLSELPPGIVVDTVPPSVWKLGTVGRGNAQKQDVASWCATLGFRGVTQDEADACALAIYAERRL